MPSIKLSIPHKLGAAEARKRITHLIAETKAQLGALVTDVEETWVEDKGAFRFKAMGFSISGTLQVEPAAVVIDINLPFAALPFKSTVEKEISTRAKALLG